VIGECSRDPLKGLEGGGGCQAAPSLPLIHQPGGRGVDPFPPSGPFQGSKISLEGRVAFSYLETRWKVGRWTIPPSFTPSSGPPISHSMYPPPLQLPPWAPGEQTHPHPPRGLLLGMQGSSARINPVPNEREKKDCGGGKEGSDTPPEDCSAALKKINNHRTKNRGEIHCTKT